MKLNVVKTIIAVCIAALVGLLCFEMADAELNRNWISFGVTTVSLLVFLILGMGLEYNAGGRTVNIILTAWLGFIALLITNIVFSLCAYNIIVYIAVAGLLTLMLFTIAYSLIPSKKE